MTEILTLQQQSKISTATVPVKTLLGEEKNNGKSEKDKMQCQCLALHQKELRVKKKRTKTLNSEQSCA